MSQLPADYSDRPLNPSNEPMRPGAKQRAPVRALPRFRLMLQAGADADVMSIVRAIMGITHFCREEATHKMWEAHHFGRSQLLITHKERAEFFAEQFAACRVPVTVEPLSPTSEAS